MCFFINSHTALSQENMIRAKIGIQVNSNNAVKMARAKDRLKTGDMLRIYVHPEKPGFIYVIYSDKKQVTLLTQVEQKDQPSTLLLPSVGEYYEIDGQSSIETFTIIVSSTAVDTIPGRISAATSYEEWAGIEKKLKDQSRIALTKKSQLPFAIAGNVRSTNKTTPQKTLVKKLRIYSGNNLIVKKYEFQIKK